MKLLLFCSLISRITCWLNVIWDACVCVGGACVKHLNRCKTY